MYVSWQAFHWIPARQVLVGDLAFIPLAIAAVCSAWRAAERCSGSRRLRQAWRLIAAAAALYLAGNLTQLVYEVSLDMKSYPGVMDAFYLGCYPGAARRNPPVPERAEGCGEQRAELILDLAIVAIGTSTVFVYAVLGPAAVAELQRRAADRVLGRVSGRGHDPARRPRLGPAARRHRPEPHRAAADRRSTGDASRR